LASNNGDQLIAMCGLKPQFKTDGLLAVDLDIFRYET